MSRGKKVLLGLALAGAFSAGILVGPLFSGGAALAQGGDDHAAQCDAHMGEAGLHQRMHQDGSSPMNSAGGMMNGRGMMGGTGSMMGPGWMGMMGH